MNDANDARQFASSPCSMHELENDWERVKAWRNERRQGLVKQRLSVDAGVRRNLSRVIVARLAELIDARAYPTLGFYWPIRGEIDVRDLARMHLAAGGQTALPVIVTKDAPVEFWRWHPGYAYRAWRAQYSSPPRAPCPHPGRTRYPPHRVRPYLLSAGLWRRLLRSNACRCTAPAARHRDRRGGCAAAHHLSATTRYADGPYRHGTIRARSGQGALTNGSPSIEATSSRPA